MIADSRADRGGARRPGLTLAGRGQGGARQPVLAAGGAHPQRAAPRGRAPGGGLAARLTAPRPRHTSSSPGSVSDPPLTEPRELPCLCSTPSCPASGPSASCWCETPPAGCCCCQLTYKRDWDLPGGVVRSASRPGWQSGGRSRRLALDVQPGDLVLTDWLPLGRLGRRGLPRLRRRHARPGRSSTTWSADPRDPDGAVLHGRRGRGTLRRLHRRAASRPRWPRRLRWPGLHRVRPLTRPRPACPVALTCLIGRPPTSTTSPGQQGQEGPSRGGKGANLAEMTNLGLPVPPGFTISTEACRAYLREGRRARWLADEVSEHLDALEETMGTAPRRPGRPAAGLGALGSEFSMPG